MAKQLILIFILLLSSSCVQPNNRGVASDDIQGMLELLREAKIVAGEDKDFGQRAMFLHELFLDSKKNIPFFLTVSHLTLALEKTLEITSVKGTSAYINFKNDAEFFEKLIKKMNQDLFVRLYFAYHLTKKFDIQKINKVLINANTKNNYLGLFLAIDSVRSILPGFSAIHSANRAGQIVSNTVKSRHTEFLTNWEHKVVFQPLINLIISKVKPEFSLYLKNIPMNPLKLGILENFFDISLAIGLQCFPKFGSRIQIQDFTDYRQRVTQSLKLSKILIGLAYDPSLSCYNDPRYKSHFQSSFFTDTLDYIKLQRVNLLYKSNPVEVSRQSLRFVDLYTKSDPVRLFNILNKNNYCSYGIEQFWQPMAQRFIQFPLQSLRTIDKISFFSKFDTLESALLRNAKINQAYISLFTVNTQRQAKYEMAIPFTWLASAGIGSFSVGKQLTYIYSSKIKENKPQFPGINRRFEKLNHKYSDEDIRSFMNPMHDIFTKKFAYISTLSVGNRDVFDSIFWQYLTVNYCGVDKLISYLKAKNYPYILRKAWDTYRRKEYLKASLMLLRYEQEKVLHPVLYESLAAQAVGKLELINEYAVAGINKKFGHITTFDEFAKSHHISPNIANLESRMAWLDHVILKHAQLFTYHQNSGTIKDVFEDLLKHINYIHALSIQN